MNFAIFIALIIFFSIRYGWSFFGGKRNTSSVPLLIKFFRKFFELLVFLIIPMSLIFELIPDFKIFNSDTLLLSVGLLFTILGLSFIFFARLERKKEWGFMGDVPVQLITTGVYSITRHPYYVGATLFSVGIYLQLNSMYILTIIPGLILLLCVIKKEEKELENLFQNKWIEYRKKVGIIPFL